MKAFRSVLAVIAGFALDFLLSIATDWILEASRIVPSAEEQLKTGLVWWALAIALVYRSVYTVAAGWLTAKLAPGRPVGHALVLGAIGTVAALAGTIAQWDLGSQWYPILLTVVSLPCTWWGGRIAAKTRVSS